MPKDRHQRSPSALGRTLVVLFICAGIAGLGLLAGGDYEAAVASRSRDPMAGFYPSDMPHYPSVQEFPAGPANQVGGSKVRMSFFTTEDDPDKVAQYYRRFWRARRFFVRDDITHLGGMVSAIDLQNGRIYQVLLRVTPKATMVFPSMTTSPLRAMETRGDASPIPLFPHSKAIINLGSQEKNASARVVLSMNSGGLEANVAHYKQVLLEGGYRAESKKQAPLGKDQRILLYRKGTKELTVSLVALGEKKVRVHIMEVGL